MLYNPILDSGERYLFDGSHVHSGRTWASILEGGSEGSSEDWSEGPTAASFSGSAIRSASELSTKVGSPVRGPIGHALVQPQWLPARAELKLPCVFAI